MNIKKQQDLLLNHDFGMPNWWISFSNYSSVLPVEIST